MQERVPSPLAEIRVLDFSHLRAGPYCTRLMAGFGASVLKVERRGTGDAIRQFPPFIDDREGLERSIPFHWLNAGKRSVTIDLKSEGGRQLALALARESDLVVESFAPGAMSRLGLDFEDLRRENPRLVVTSVSNFGQTGPYRDFRADEAVLYAMSGAMVTTGDPDRPPLAPGPAAMQYTAGAHAYVGSLMALRRARATGLGEHVDVSIQESALEAVEIHLAEFAEAGKTARRTGDQHPLVPWQVYPCRDGHAAVIGAPMRHWHKAAELFGEPRFAQPEFAHVGGRIERRREVESMIRPWLDAHDKEEVAVLGKQAGFAFAELASLQEALESPQHRARHFFVDSDPHPEVGSLKVCAAPFRLAGTTWTVGRAPCLGEHNDSVLAELLGHTPVEIETLRDAEVI